MKKLILALFLSSAANADVIMAHVDERVHGRTDHNVTVISKHYFDITNNTKDMKSYRWNFTLCVLKERCTYKQDGFTLQPGAHQFFAETNTFYVRAPQGMTTTMYAESTVWENSVKILYDRSNGKLEIDD